MLRQLRPRDLNGGKDGVVLNMTMSGDGIWNASVISNSSRSFSSSPVQNIFRSRLCWPGPTTSHALRRHGIIRHLARLNSLLDFSVFLLSCHALRSLAVHADGPIRQPHLPVSLFMRHDTAISMH